jgi:heterodisulfide reductase subunit B
MREYALFLGCTVPVRALNYEISARKIADAFGIKLVDLEDFTCCGFTIKSINYDAALTMAARSLAIAEEKKQDICTLCSACTSFLTEVNKELREDSRLKKEIDEDLASIGRVYNGTVEVKHLARILHEDIGIDKIREKVKKPLKELKIAAHYGCHYLKPSEIYNFEDPEAPFTLDELIEATGATSVDYEKKSLCCGGGILGIDEDIALEMSNEKLESIRDKADAMVLICPFCDIMYDINQKRIETKFERDYKIPVLYYPQLLGLALGFNPRELGLDMNRVKTTSLLETIKSERGK